VSTRARVDAGATSLAFLQELFRDYRPRDFAVRLWDGREWRPETDRPDFTIVVRHPAALRAFLGRSERALAEAYLHDDLEIEGDVYAAIAAADHLLVERDWSRRERLRQAARLFSLPAKGSGAGNGHPPARLRGSRFSLARDRDAVTYHYDRSNEFFALWLDQRMTYSCAYWERPDETLERAQERKLDLICCKLRLRPGERVLDIGCGWGSFVLYAAERYGAEVVGVTPSENQAEVARERIRAAGLQDRCRIEVRDYRELDEPAGFDKIASIGIHIHKWVTTHGYALNVDLDPSPFTDWITACGLEGAAFTTMSSELERPLSVDDVRPAAADAMAEVFGLTFEELPADEGVGLWHQDVHARLART